MSSKLGILKNVDVRSQWQNEAFEFTPWLAKEENISLLSDEIGIELEVENTEVAVGPYSADILAKDTSSGNYVVIENQLAKTNHDHLGKAITYASVLNASAIIWIASEFTEEHKKALDWLNDNISEDISLFGVKVELWKIDSSDPAIKFNIISRPADFARKSSITKASSSELSDVKKFQLEWWQTFRESLLSNKILKSAQKARPQYWYNITLGRTGLHLSNIASISKNKIGVRLYLRNKYKGDEALNLLELKKEDIEKEIGQKLKWNPNPDARDKIIALYKNVNLSQKDKWDEYIKWMINITQKFLKTFSPRIKELKFTEDIESDIED